MNVSGQAEKGLGRKHLRLGREVGRLADGEVIGVIGRKDMQAGNAWLCCRKDKHAGSGQYHDIQDDLVWLGTEE